MDNKKKAVIFIIISTLGFALMSFFVKLAVDVPSLQKAFYRNLVSVFFMFFILIKRVTKKHANNHEKFNVNENINENINENLKENLVSVFKPKEPKFLFYRSLFGTLGVVLTFYTIDRLILADSTILTRMSPFFTVLTASLFLGEKLNKKVGIAMIISFVGIFLVVKPAFDIVLLPYIIGITASVLSGVAYTFLRVLGSKGEDSDVIVFYFSLFSTVVLFPMAYMVYKDMNLVETVYVLLASTFALFAQTFLTRAYKLANANDISVYLNLQVIFTAVLGVIFLNEVPDILSVLGYIIIIGSSYWAFNAKPKVGE